MSAPWPTELFVPSGRNRLRVSWDDGAVHEIEAELLRVLTPSAERKGHGARVVIGGKRAVTLSDIRPVGRYAVRIVFDDGHSSGLYTFASLREFGTDGPRLLAAYETELAATGLDRDRPGTAPAPA